MTDETKNPRNPDGRILLAYLIEKNNRENGGSYFKATNFGATDLLLTAGANPKFNHNGEKVWLLYAIPQNIELPNSREGAAKAARRIAAAAKQDRSE